MSSGPHSKRKGRRRSAQDPHELLAVNMVRLRKVRNLTQDDLALETGISRKTINAMEQGDRNVTLETLDKLANGLGCAFHELFAPLAPHK